jgi:hypothetical protein
MGKTARILKMAVLSKNIYEVILEEGHDEDFEPIADSQFLPTDAPAGSPEKIDILTNRVELGQPLWHQDDRVDYEGLHGLSPVARSHEVQAPGPGSQNDTVTGKVSLLLSDFELFLPATDWGQACWEQAKRDFSSISLAGVEAPGSYSLFETPKCKLKSTGPSISPPKKEAKPSNLHAGKAGGQARRSKEQPRRRPSAATLTDKPQHNQTIYVRPPTPDLNTFNPATGGIGEEASWPEFAGSRQTVTTQEDRPKDLKPEEGVKTEILAATTPTRVGSAIQQGAGLGELQQPLARKAGNKMEEQVEPSATPQTEVLSASQEPPVDTSGSVETAIVSILIGTPTREPIATEAQHERPSATREGGFQNTRTTFKKQVSHRSWRRREPTASRAEALEILGVVRRKGPSFGQAQQTNGAVSLRKPTSEEISRFCFFSQAQTEGSVSGNPTQGYLNDLKEKGVDCSLLERCHNGDFDQSKLQELLKLADDK